MAALALGELALRLVEGTGSGNADGVLDYGDTWRSDGLGPGGYLRASLEARVRDGYGGTVRWRTDAAGFRRDGETSPEPAPGALRLLSLGDSFTAGYRVDQEATFSRRLEQALESRSAEILVAVTEEPATALAYFGESGLAWKPDAVLLGLTLGNDIAQSYAALHPVGPYRWDQEILLANADHDAEGLQGDLIDLELPPGCQSQEPPPAPRFRGLQRRSALARALGRLGEGRRGQAIVSTWQPGPPTKLLDSNGLGVFLEDPPLEIRRAYENLFLILAAAGEQARENGVAFAVALFPQRYQVQPADWSRTVEVYGLDPGCFDLLGPNRRLAAFARDAGIPLFDPTADLARLHEETGVALYLPAGDMHWNAAGHRAFAEAVAPAVDAWLSGS